MFSTLKWSLVRQHMADLNLSHLQQRARIETPGFQRKCVPGQNGLMPPVRSTQQY